MKNEPLFFIGDCLELRSQTVPAQGMAFEASNSLNTLALQVDGVL